MPSRGRDAPAAKPPKGRFAMLNGLSRRFAVWRREGIPPAWFGWALWIAFLVAASWRVNGLSTLSPSPGLDQGYMTGLNIAHINGLSWGPDIVFTGGPLGYLYLPKALSGGIVALSIVYLALVYSSFFAVVIWQLRHRYGAYVAVAGSFVLFCLLRLDAPEATTMTAVLVGASFLAGELAPRIERWVPLLFGAAAAIQLLVKTNTGLLIAVMGLWISLIRPERWRRLLEFAGAFLAVFVAAWLSLGQSLADVPLWLIRTESVISGYASAMAVGSPSQNWVYYVALVLLFAVLVLAVVGLELESGTRSWPLLVFALLASWFIFKSGMIRFHVFYFFFFLIVLIAALPWRPAWRGAALIVLVATIAIIPEVTFNRLPTDSWITRPTNVHGFFQNLHAGVSQAQRDTALSGARLNVKRADPIPNKLIRLVGAEPVHIDSLETSVAWAYSLNWRPVPAFQSYLAYTQRLDEANADRLLESDGPTRVLRHKEIPIDGRYRLQESPEYMLTLVCNFNQIGAGGDWQVLARGRNRCGEAVKLGEARLETGRSVAVPSATAANMIVVGRIKLEPSLSWRLKNLAFKPPISMLAIDGVYYRLVPETAAGPMLLHLTPSLGWSPELAPRLKQPIDTQQIGLNWYSGAASVSFYEIPVRPGA